MSDNIQKTGKSQPSSYFKIVRKFHISRSGSRSRWWTYHRTRARDCRNTLNHARVVHIRSTTTKGPSTNTFMSICGTCYLTNRRYPEDMALDSSAVKIAMNRGVGASQFCIICAKNQPPNQKYFLRKLWQFWSPDATMRDGTSARALRKS